MSFRTGKKKDGSKYHYPISDSNGYSSNKLDIHRVESISRRKLDSSDLDLIREQIARIGFDKFGNSHTGFVGIDSLKSGDIEFKTESLSDRFREMFKDMGDDVSYQMLDEYETAYFYNPDTLQVEYLGDDGKIGWLEARNFIEQNPDKYFVTFYSEGNINIYETVGKIPKKFLKSIEEVYDE